MNFLLEEWAATVSQSVGKNLLSTHAAYHPRKSQTLFKALKISI